MSTSELVGWEPSAFTHGVDLAILPTGVFEHDPLSGERKIAAGHPVLNMEATFHQALDMIQSMSPGRVILTHIEKQDGFSYDDLNTIAAALRGDGHRIEFAYDTLVIDVG